MTHINPTKWITIQKLAEATGYSEKALRNKIMRGDFLQGIHYRKSPDGRIHFNLEAYEKWVEGQTPIRAPGSGHIVGAS